MAFANSNVSDLIAAGIDSRTGEVASNVAAANPIHAVMKAKGRVKPISGGNQIIEELSFNANPNGGAYDGYDILPTAAADVISAAVYDWKQYAVAITVSGKEQMQNSGKEALLDLIEERVQVGEDTMANLIDAGMFGDGTGFGGKAIGGLQYLLENQVKASQDDVVGGISKATWSFWRNWYYTGSTNDTTGALARAALNASYAETSRGNDQPDIGLLGSVVWQRYLQGAQQLQLFTNPTTAAFGFQTVKHLSMDLFLMGGAPGVGGADYSAATTANSRQFYTLNTKYLRFRPHAKRNFVSGGTRESANQDASTRFLLFMGNLTCRGMQFQGRMLSSD
jgi:hypothetical protein